MNKRLIFFDSSYPPPVKGGKEKQAHNLALILKYKNYDVIALTTNEKLSIRFSRYEGILRVSVSYMKDFFSKFSFWEYIVRKENIKNIYFINRQSHLEV